MKTFSFASVMIVFLLLVYVDFAKAEDAAEQKARVNVARELFYKEYFKLISCPDFTNVLLLDSGLPLIGRRQPVKGQRGVSHREFQKNVVPELDDEVTHSKEHIQISTKALGPQHWQLQIHRDQLEGKKAKLETIFNFSVKMQNNEQLCDLDSVNFGFFATNDKVQYAKLDCLDIFAMPAAQGEGSPQIFDWLHRDCALALHYLRPVKDLLNPPQKQKAGVAPNLN